MQEFIVVAVFKGLLKAQFIVRATTPEAAIDEVTKLDIAETTAGDQPLYPTGSTLMCEPVEYIGNVCVL